MCGLCGHAMTLDRCGRAGVNDMPLCHADDHDCYTAWTVYKIRPHLVGMPAITRWVPPEVRESIEIARAKIAADELAADGPNYFTD